MMIKTAQNFPNPSQLGHTSNSSKFDIKKLFAWFKFKDFNNLNNSNNFLDISITHQAIFNELSLRIRDDLRIVTVDTATALNLLSGSNSQVHVINSNIADQATLEIQCSAILHLVDYPAVVKFLSVPNQVDNQKRYLRHLQKQLSPQALAYWEKKDLFGRARYAHFKKNTPTVLPPSVMCDLKHHTINTYPQVRNDLPVYLQEHQFIELRNKIRHLHQHHQSLLSFLETQKNASIGSFFLKDQIKELSQEEMLATCLEIDRCSIPGAQLIVQSQDEQAILDCISASQLEKNWYLSRSLAPFFVFSKR